MPSVSPVCHREALHLYSKMHLSDDDDDVMMMMGDGETKGSRGYQTAWIRRASGANLLTAVPLTMPFDNNPTMHVKT